MDDQDKTMEQFYKEIDRGEHEDKEEVLKKEPEASLVSSVIKWSEIKGEEYNRDWIWENYIAKGDITAMSAFYKSGKSTFLRCLFRAIGKETEFIGQPTTKTNILIISEESAGLWREYRRGLSKKDIKHVFVSARPVSMSVGSRAWGKMVDEVGEWAEKNEVGLVVIDSISNFWQIDDENQATQVKKALVPFWGITNRKIGVFLIHHDKKSGGDEGLSMRGSGAFGAFVDHIVIFRRDKGDSSSPVRTLSYYGRSLDAPQNLMIEYNTEGEYVALGDPYQVSQQARQDKMVSLFEKSGVSLSRQEVQDLWISQVGKINKSTTYRLLRKLIEKEVLRCTGRKVINNRKTPVYGLTGWKEQRAFHSYPLAEGSATKRMQRISETNSATNRGSGSLNERFVADPSPKETANEGLSDAENNPFLGDHGMKGKEPPKGLI